MCVWLSVFVEEKRFYSKSRMKRESITLGILHLCKTIHPGIFVVQLGTVKANGENCIYCYFTNMVNVHTPISQTTSNFETAISMFLGQSEETRQARGEHADRPQGGNRTQTLDLQGGRHQSIKQQWSIKPLCRLM